MTLYDELDLLKEQYATLFWERHNLKIKQELKLLEEKIDKLYRSFSYEKPLTLDIVASTKPIFHKCKIERSGPRLRFG